MKIVSKQLSLRLLLYLQIDIDFHSTYNLIKKSNLAVISSAANLNGQQSLFLNAEVNLLTRVTKCVTRAH